MKTSIKLLIIVAGIIVAMLITGLIILRTDLKNVIRTELESKYTIVPVENFHSLNFSPHWDVSIRQGRDWKVMLENEKPHSLNPSIKNIADTLFFKMDTSLNGTDFGPLHVRITAPKLNVIKAAEGTTIDMKAFSSDSLMVMLNDKGSFTGNENLFEYIFFKTSGDAVIHWTDDPMK